MAKKKDTICYFTFQRPGQALLKDYAFNGGGYVIIAEIFFSCVQGKGSYIGFVSLRDQGYQHKSSDWTLQG